MKFFGRLFIALITLVVFAVLVWVFLAAFWFNNLYDPIAMANNYFSAQALSFARGNGSPDWSPAAPQFIGDSSIFGSIPQMYAFISAGISSGPLWVSPIVLGYILPFAMGMTFAGLILFIVWMFYHFAYGKRHRKAKKGRYDEYDSRVNTHRQEGRNYDYPPRDYDRRGDSRRVRNTRQYEDDGYRPTRRFEEDEPYGYRPSREYPDRY
ncbi:MG319/MPN454 family protein [[Mycoplasma] testudinis]|uniref:MG319/MPN454 family protein n=1 Tax=[Mycoplasma] testudinis TaxID=33924 RepID=UPI000484D36F|nr:hypothetical protein [[Mycoplasma] testudinis]